MPQNLPVILALDNIRSLHNVGAIFRSADAAGCQKILLGGLTPIPPRPEIEKTALGASKTIAWEYTKRLPELLLTHQRQGFTLCALEQTDQALNLFTTPVEFPLVLIIGHEREGVSRECLDLCASHFFLPMEGQSAHSLNVSNATAVALYELLRRFCYY